MTCIEIGDSCAERVYDIGLHVAGHQFTVGVVAQAGAGAPDLHKNLIID